MHCNVLHIHNLQKTIYDRHKQHTKPDQTYVWNHYRATEKYVYL
jgi:hypothetical protein